MQQSILKAFAKEIRNDYFALLSLFLLGFILLAVFIGAPIVNMLHDVMWVNPQRLPVSPSESGTILGLDRLGRNQFHLLFVAARNSLYLAFGVTFFSFLLGATIGIISGFYGGKIDNLIMRVTDTWSMLPFLMVVMVLLSVFGRTVLNFILFLSLFTWVGRARLIRAAALSVRQADYISASKTLGTPDIVIILREMLPNLADIIVANFVLTLAASIGIETGLSLLGFGLGWDYPSLGVMMQNAVNPMYLRHFPWVWAPSLILVCTFMLCVNFIGNALQRAVDPRQRTR
ncbi:MAG: ABC transporter permease [Defluviitaleaceae bacterium]|nr:ABC transporter permease [Defluviitaleaceae bacterium]